LTSAESDGRAVERTASRGSGTQTATHSGQELREMFAAATTWLERNAEAINSINVFPVPDGDTGTNMYLTMRATMDEAYESGSDAAGVVAKAMAKGALMGARGNSGVILSQALRGLANSLSDKDRFDGVDFAAALDEAALSAQRAVSHPVEGTILTVMREVAAAAGSRSRKLGSSLKSVLASAVEAAKDAVAKTPTLLPVLREAGVVDAGGQGLYVILEGALRYLRGDLASLAPLAIQDPERTWLKATLALHDGGATSYGYCTEFLVMSEKLDAKTTLDRMVELGDSVLVVGDESLLRVHLHTSEPGAAIGYGTSLGKITDVKVENIQLQADEFAVRARAGYEPDLFSVGTVIVASGRGLEEVFRSLGATAIVSGGQTTNPSIQQILAAIDSCPQNDIILLPNNKNVVLAAEQAAHHSKKNVKVVNSVSIPQGMAALLALNLEKGLDENAVIMGEARQQVGTIEVTRAIRSTKIDGLRIQEGQAIALLDGKLAVVEATAADAVRASLKRMVTTQTALVTIYYGGDATKEDAQTLADDVAAEHPSLDIEVVYGGQPHYSYIVSLE
jgi:DAK2 domain fusion protein YloV